MKADSVRVDRQPTLALGTAQWGLRYGIANQSGQPQLVEVRRILDSALGAGISMLDTASAYGSAERVIGQIVRPSERESIRVVTKVLPDPGVDDPHQVRRATEQQLEQSRQLLGMDRLDTVLLHRESLRNHARGEAWQVLREWAARGRIRSVGVSAETPDAAERALEDPEVRVLQVAASIVDRRMVDRGVFQRARLTGVEVHVRSVFLQGIAFLPPDGVPQRLRSLSGSLRTINDFALRQGVPPQVVWLSYVFGLSARHLVVGIERNAQLHQVLGWSSDLLSWSRVAALAAALPDLRDDVLDPARW